MTITAKPKQKATNVDEFIGAAPDAISARAEIPKGPATKRGTNRSQVSVVLPDALLMKIDEKAKAEYMTRSAWISMAVKEFLAR